MLTTLKLWDNHGFLKILRKGPFSLKNIMAVEL